MYKKCWITLLSCLMVVSLSACYSNRDGATGTSQPNNMNQNGVRSQQVNPNHVRPHHVLPNATSPNNAQPYGTNGGINQNSRMTMNKVTADKLVTMPGVQSAYVMLMGHNAYVGVMLKNRNDGTTASDLNQTQSHTTQAANTMTGLTMQLKQQIAEKVQALNPDVRNVYVTADPNFVDLLNRYAGDVEQGRPISGMVDQLNTMMQRLFPTNAANGSNPDGTYRQMNR